MIHILIVFGDMEVAFMNWIWFALIALSVVCGLFTGRINEVSQAALGGACDSVSLFLTLLGSICLWNGLMKIAESCGITRLLASLMSPVVKRLFPDLPPSGAGMKAISMNIAANFLGLGNAATPFGLQAMNEMAKKSPQKGVATDSMVMFIVINTASLQLIPTTIAVIRMKCGSTAPFDILPCVWLASFVTLICGIMFARIFEKSNRLKVTLKTPSVDKVHKKMLHVNKNFN
jgi:spore maturation protein A